MRAIPCAVLVLLFSVAPWRGGGPAAARALNFTRADFPRDFVFGAGTSAYQVLPILVILIEPFLAGSIDADFVLSLFFHRFDDSLLVWCLYYEGATDEDGRSPSIWDTFTHAGKMPDKSTGDLGADGYHRYKEDVELMSETGLEAYRFSISWSRLIPRGRGPVNPKGLEYYNNLINELTKRGIQIHVTLYHLDFPQILEDEYHGWLSPRVVDDFTAFADTCFREFGDRVQHWTTMDEPNVISIAAYDSGAFPPCRCSAPFGVNCTTGDSTMEPYTVAHNSILAHASIVRLYREKYQATQKGVVGMNVYSFWNYPFSSSPADIAATQRSLDFMISWILDPLVYGDYPKIMKKKAGSRIPSFTKEQSKLIRGAIDFVGINHYTSVYVSDGKSSADASLRDYNADMSATFRMSRNDSGTGQFIPINMPNDPQGLQSMLKYLTDRYPTIPIYVQENGYGQLFVDSVNDHNRVEYLSGYIGSTLTALRNGANVKGYFVWSFMDVFELLAGHYIRYGLHYIDFQDPGLTRQPKLSAKWYSKFLRNEIGINIESMVSPDAGSHDQQ